MKLARFNIIFMIDSDNGFSAGGFPPRAIASWTKYIRDTTIGTTKNNAVIMGRNTYDFMRSKLEPGQELLPFREKYVISTTYQNQDQRGSVVVYDNFGKCLAGLANRGPKKNDEVWVIGGARLIHDCIRRYLPYCDKIIICKLIHESHECDIPFQMSLLTTRSIEPKEQITTADYKILVHVPHIVHQENQIIKLLADIIDHGNKIIDPVNDEHYRALNNKTLSFNIAEEFPVITTRYFDHQEVLKTFFDDIDNFDFATDSIGFRLRCANKKFTGMKSYESENNIDQLEDVVGEITKHSKKTLYLSHGIDDTTNIPICIRLSSSSSKKYLNASVICNEMEMFKYFPNYLVYVGLLVSCIAYVCGLVPRMMHWYIAEAKIRSDYVEFAKKQIQNDPKPWANLCFRNAASIRVINDFKKDNLEIRNYDSWVKLNFEKKS